MQYGMNSIQAKQPRYHPVIAWEANNLTNEFVDINRMALDDRYGHNGAPLSKRRNGVGFTRGNTTGLFGMGGMVNYKSQKNAYFAGMVAAGVAYAVGDWYLNKGYGLTGWKRRVARSPITASLLIITAVAVAPSD